MKNKVYEIVAGRIMDAIEQGALPPWVKPWYSAGCGLRPQSLITKKPYRGVNAMLLTMAGGFYESPYYVSFKQAQELGGKIRKGEHPFPIVFWSFLDTKDDEGHLVVDDKGRTKKHILIRYYNVFNTDQVEGIGDKIPAIEKPKTLFTTDQEAERIMQYLDREQIKVYHGGDRACYSPRNDDIHLPLTTNFKRSIDYYATAFHEMGHSTGAEKRLHRKGVTDFDHFGSEQYSKEELIAELTSTFLCGVCGFEDKIEINSASYLAGWMTVLKDDPCMLVEAAQGAQKAADYILGVQYSQE